MHRSVTVNCDIHCDSTAHPVYRLYVHNELFAERQWIWQDVYLEELLQISAPPGKYNIRVENTTPELGTVIMQNVRVAQGSAHIANNQLEIYP